MKRDVIAPVCRMATHPGHYATTRRRRSFMAAGGWACMRSGGDTTRLPWTSLRRQSNSQRCPHFPIFHAKVGSRFFSLHLPQDSSYTSHVPGIGGWRHTSAVERRRLGSPLGVLRAAEHGSVKSVGKYALVVTSALFCGAFIFSATFVLMDFGCRYLVKPENVTPGEA